MCQWTRAQVTAVEAVNFGPPGILPAVHDHATAFVCGVRVANDPSFPLPIANSIISGAFTFYVLYDCMHYALHHTRLPAYLKEMKKYHLAHHYKNFDLGFNGVTSKFWDIVFNTVLPV
ncbi:hypothetical protein GGU11DRAFT_847285 [Lentinula aff. detonsa]|nr:hypothetical protein GGU11DRAFT_847285 [Lentinula aff. detonsa]